jgi:hypothetical protein
VAIRVLPPHAWHLQGKKAAIGGQGIARPQPPLPLVSMGNIVPIPGGSPWPTPLLPPSAALGMLPLPGLPTSEGGASEGDDGSDDDDVRALPALLPSASGGELASSLSPLPSGHRPAASAPSRDSEKQAGGAEGARVGPGSLSAGRGAGVGVEEEDAGVAGEGAEDEAEPQAESFAEYLAAAFAAAELGDRMPALPAGKAVLCCMCVMYNVWEGGGGTTEDGSNPHMPMETQPTWASTHALTCPHTLPLERPAAQGTHATAWHSIPTPAPASPPPHRS